MKIIQFVRQFAALGIACMPLHHRSKEPMLPMWRHLQDRLPTNTEYLDWFRTDWCNYGVIAGWCNLVVLDFDTFEWFALWQLVMRESGLNWIAETSFKVITSHGMHVYLRTAEKADNSKRIAISGGIDVQAQGRYVVGPGCVHPSGTQYVPVGALNLIQVQSVEQVLPMQYFPHVKPDHVQFNGMAPEFHNNHTEYIDPLTFASMDLISKVKASVRIESLFTGIQRSSTDGRWLKALCPFHQDKHQSAWIDTVRQLCGCQVCGMKPMDVVNVYARMHNLSDSAAVRAMAAEVGVWR